jgi:hypothetical protein
MKNNSNIQLTNGRNRVKFDTFNTKDCDLLICWSVIFWIQATLFILAWRLDIYIVHMTHGKLGSQVQASHTFVPMPKQVHIIPSAYSLSPFCVKNFEVFEVYLKSGSCCCCRRRLLLFIYWFKLLLSQRL